MLVILFAAPFAAFGDLQFTDNVIRDDNAPLLQRLREIQSSGILPMTAPTSTRVDILVVYPHSWSASDTSAFMGELALADGRLHQILANSNSGWLSFPKVAVVRLSHDPSSLYSPHDDPEVQALRLQYGADRVVAIVDEFPAAGGAMLCGAYAVVKRSALYEAYAHEVFHTVCLDHEEETAGTPAPAGFEANRAMYVCPIGGGDGFASYMTQSSPCGWYNAERVTGRGVFFQGVELVGPHAQAPGILAIAAPLAAAEMDAPLGPCVPGDTTLCLDGVRNSGDRRFEVRVSYDSDFAHVNGDGRVADWSSPIGGLFYFFTGDNPELLVKIINGCASNGHFWVYLTAGTNLGYTVTIRDTISNLPPFELSNPDAVLAVPFADIEAIPCN